MPQDYHFWQRWNLCLFILTFLYDVKRVLSIRPMVYNTGRDELHWWRRLFTAIRLLIFSCCYIIRTYAGSLAVDGIPEQCYSNLSTATTFSTATMLRTTFCSNETVYSRASTTFKCHFYYFSSSRSPAPTMFYTSITVSAIETFVERSINANKLSLDK